MYDGPERKVPHNLVELGPQRLLGSLNFKVPNRRWIANGLGSEYPFGRRGIAVDDQPNTRRGYGHWSRDKACVRDGKTGAIWARLYVRQPIDLRSHQQDKNPARL